MPPLQRLAEELGKPLFVRNNNGWHLTDAGHLLVPHAEAMEAAALFATETVDGETAAASGKVRLGMPEVFATMVLAPRLPALIAERVRICTSNCCSRRVLQLWRRAKWNSRSSSTHRIAHVAKSRD